jgi:hypothetical protein
LAEAPPFDCSRTATRHPRETKGESYRHTSDDAGYCEPGGCCQMRAVAPETPASRSYRAIHKLEEEPLDVR